MNWIGQLLLLTPSFLVENIQLSLNFRTSRNIPLILGRILFRKHNIQRRHIITGRVEITQVSSSYWHRVKLTSSSSIILWLFRKTGSQCQGKQSWIGALKYLSIVLSNLPNHQQKIPHSWRRATTYNQRTLSLPPDPHYLSLSLTLLLLVSIPFQSGYYRISVVEVLQLWNRRANI